MTVTPYEDLYIYYLEGRLPYSSGESFTGFLGNWEEDGYTFLFFSNAATAQINTLLATRPELTLLDEFQMSYEEWQGGRLQPTRIGGFLILPPWHEDTDTYQDVPGSRRILLDPGVVFGNGAHPTTRDCIGALERVFEDRSIESVLDFGTGTGLLALAAAKFGCRRCLALDFNFLAARTALKNVRLNQLEHIILICQGNAENFMNTPADLLIANIHYDVMCRLVRSDGFLEKESFILSGLLRSEADRILRDLSGMPVRIVQCWEHDHIWHTIYGERRR